jgi:hypothetical protein
VGKVDQTAQVIPDVLPPHGHDIAHPNGDTLPYIHIIFDQDGLARGATHDEALMLVLAEGVG